MSDTIRWCFTHSKQQAIVGACEACFNESGYMKYMAYQCEIVTMIRADQPAYRIDHRKGFPTEIEEALEDEWLVRIGDET